MKYVEATVSMTKKKASLALGRGGGQPEIDTILNLEALTGPSFSLTNLGGLRTAMMSLGEVARRQVVP